MNLRKFGRTVGSIFSISDIFFAFTIKTFVFVKWASLKFMISITIYLDYRSLTTVGRNYSHVEKKRALNITLAVKKFHQYIYEQTVAIQIDHKPLLGLLAEHKSKHIMEAARIQRWEIILYT